MVTVDRLLSVEEVAEALGTTVRFPRRLIEERRITFVKVGRHVRIPESAVSSYVTEHTVQPARIRRAGLRRAA
ncbi:excisionase family DNA-binding protein [Streptomyces sp. NPDC048527]|uniref:excisionase family DNA-binding protein n=1 Tax=Streptomyces sp. NPDC048527 TaxID=3365568 RepID=UPI003714DC6B